MFYHLIKLNLPNHIMRSRSSFFYLLVTKILENLILCSQFWFLICLGQTIFLVFSF